MAIQDHVTSKKALAYRSGEEIQKWNYEAHVATCPGCARIDAAAKAFGDSVGRAFTSQERSQDCPPVWEIASLVNGETPAESRPDLSAHMTGCDACRDEAARFFLTMNHPVPALEVPEEWERKAVSRIAVDLATKSSVDPIRREPTRTVPDRRTFRDRFLGFFVSPLPAWGLAAATLAALAFVLTQDRGRVVVVPSSERVVFRESGIPGATMGFMGSADEKAWEGMKAVSSGGRILFRWKPVPGAQAGEFVLMEAGTGRAVARMASLSSPEAAIDQALVAKGKLYRWSVRGATIEGKSYEYTGDVVFVE
jgi:hypothetical protein